MDKVSQREDQADCEVYINTKYEEIKKKPVCDVFFAKAEKSSLVLCFIE